MITLGRFGGVEIGVTDGGLAAKTTQELAGGELRAGVELRRDDAPRVGVTWKKRF